MEVFAPADDHTSLFDHIKSQMLERALPPEICRTILYIISGLDKSGIRTETENEIASDLSVEETKAVVNKGNDLLLEKFNEAIAAFMAEDNYNDLIVSYFG